jgi:hypothetical protein
MQENLTTALVEIGVLRDEVLRGAHRGPVSEEARGGPRGADARPGGVIIAAPVPAPCGKRRAEVVEEKGADIIDLCSSDEEEPEGSRRVSRKRRRSRPSISQIASCGPVHIQTQCLLSSFQFSLNYLPKFKFV